MYFTYLRRELAGRRRQTAIVAIGLALAIALVIIVNSLSAGVKDAQNSVLASVYGVGTDISVTQKPSQDTGPGDGQFAFKRGEGQTANGTTTVAQSRLTTTRGTSTMAATALASVKKVPNVAGAAATLELTSTTFSGKLPDRSQQQSGGGSSFSIDSFSVAGVDPAADTLGPLSAASLKSGRTLAATDVGKDVAVLDSAYATTKNLAVGGTIKVAGTSFKVIGIVGSASADATTAANAYVPLDIAQKLSGMTGKITNIYVQASSSTQIGQIKTDLTKTLPTATVSTQEDLAASVSGSLSTTASLVSNLGLWLSVALLVAAFALAILFTISGVSRRTREFGTLKAIGWSNWRITRQVAGESLAQGLVGGAAGVALGLIGTLIINLVSPTLGAGVATSAAGRFPGSAARAAAAGARAAAGSGQFRGAAASTTDIILHAPLSVWVIFGAVALAVLGGLLAGVIGGWRAARLSPAVALRSLA